MQVLLIKLRQRRRRLQHVEFLRSTIAALHNEIVHEVLEDKDPKNKAFLFKKYLRRLNYLGY
tara:strand:- start:47 stop:232 length:186 start_codon:yes stop_codon:yes gene_type:complete